MKQKPKSQGLGIPIRLRGGEDVKYRSLAKSEVKDSIESHHPIGMALRRFLQKKSGVA
jgi:hypothetical protein